ncbi:DUF866 domain-containing protein [Aspergillus sp. HF37]|nr:DUF866 domain-containing protein [Aspergillus sp. HF37]
MLSLLLSAELSGVKDLRPTDTEEEPYYYTFRVQCTSCRETHPNWVSFNRFEQHEIPGSRGEANFVWKCRLCQVTSSPPPLLFVYLAYWTMNLTTQTTQKTHSASIVAGPNTYTAADADSKRRAQVISLDCRGLEFGEWEAKGAESSTGFGGIDLTEGEWYDYDEKAGDEVSIKELNWEIGRA